MHWRGNRMAEFISGESQDYFSQVIFSSPQLSNYNPVLLNSPRGEMILRRWRGNPGELQLPQFSLTGQLSRARTSRAKHVLTGWDSWVGETRPRRFSRITPSSAEKHFSLGRNEENRILVRELGRTWENLRELGLDSLADEVNHWVLLYLHKRKIASSL